MVKLWRWKLILESFTAFAITIIRTRAAVPVWATAAKLCVRFALGFVYTIYLIGFRSASTRSFISVLKSPPLFRTKLIRRRLFEIHASLTVTKIGSFAAIVSVWTAISVFVIRIASGENAVYFRYFSSTSVTKYIYQKCTVCFRTLREIFVLYLPRKPSFALSKYHVTGTVGLIGSSKIILGLFP